MYFIIVVFQDKSITIYYCTIWYMPVHTYHKVI